MTTSTTVSTATGKARPSGGGRQPSEQAIDAAIDSATRLLRLPTFRDRYPEIADAAGRVQDLATAIALGGDCLADIAVVRAQSELFGQVASDPTVSRLVDKLAGDLDSALHQLRQARADARAVAWQHRSPVRADGLVPVDIDGTIVVAHSEKESAAATFKRTFGFHPLLAFVDHGSDGDGGGGEPLAAVLRAGSANANAAADHIAVLDLALQRLPQAVRARVLVRTDSGGGTKAFLTHVSSLGLQYSTGIGVSIGIDRDLLAPAAPPAVDSGARQHRHTARRSAGR